ncbi:DinB family protein [Paenibacillus cellulositrophicus]|uniref:DinB family protein n=1 Tax=Paenibacillus cellulositrophicus TaxID=562959 RepID=UPI003D999513
MLYDLKGGANMAPMVGTLYSAVKENIQRLQSITNGMLQEEMDYKGPDNKFNSTAQLIRHLMYVDLNWVYRIKGLPLPQSLQKQYGPMIQLTDADLEKTVTFGHENEKQATIRWGIWHMADHNRYHQAHINLLRKWYKEK